MIKDSKPSRSDLSFFFEGFSLLTAGGFLASALVNAFSFKERYDLNYFQIAQPSDVVMSGFQNVAWLSFIVMVVGATLALFMPMLAKRLKRGATHNRFRGLGWFLIGLTAAPFTYLMGSLSTYDSKRSPSLPTTGINGLVLSSDSPYAGKCGEAPVLWIGSTSMLINCRNKVAVIHNTQGLMITRR